MPSSSAGLEDLRARIHGMRLSLLFGGDKVKSAEGEAIDFYNQRIEVVNRSLDSIQTDLAEKRTSYDVALEQTLSGRDPAAAMHRAQAVRAEVAALEHEGGELSSRRTNLDRLIRTVQARQREREVLAGRMEASASADDDPGFTLGSVGLAPEVQVRPDVSPFDDPGLVQDLVTRDPVAAGRILFEADAERYFRVFPLRPPAASLRAA